MALPISPLANFEMNSRLRVDPVSRGKPAALEFDRDNKRRERELLNVIYDDPDYNDGFWGRDGIADWNMPDLEIVTQPECSDLISKIQSFGAWDTPQDIEQGDGDPTVLNEHQASNAHFHPKMPPRFYRPIWEDEAPDTARQPNVLLQAWVEGLRIKEARIALLSTLLR